MTSARKPDREAKDLYGEDLKCPRCHQRIAYCICKKEPGQKEKRQPKPTKDQIRRDKEIEARVQPITEMELRFRHGHWIERRKKVHEALRAGTTSPTLIERFENCGSGCAVQWSETLQKNRLNGNYCKCRHCEPCMRAKANRIAANLRSRLSTGAPKSYRFITLTLKHNTAPLTEQIKKLYASFKKLRANPIWKKTQRGGVFMCEIKLVEPRHGQAPGSSTADGMEWHPHLHIIAEGSWLNQNDLSQAWLQATGDSSIVDIALVPTRREQQSKSQSTPQQQEKAPARAKDVAAYVCKYITKSTSPTVWEDPARAAEWLIASKGLRTCATFGSWRGFKLTAVVKQADDWVHVDFLNALINRSRSGEEHAATLLSILRPPGDFDYDDHIQQ